MPGPLNDRCFYCDASKLAMTVQPLLPELDDWTITPCQELLIYILGHIDQCPWCGDHWTTFTLDSI